MERRAFRWGFTELFATTGAIPFFEPALKMYESLGYEEESREQGDFFEKIHLKKSLL